MNLQLAYAKAVADRAAAICAMGSDFGRDPVQMLRAENARSGSG